MIYYWILLLLILFLTQTGENPTSRNRALLLSVFSFFLFFAFRVGFTPDYYNYEVGFPALHSGRLDVEGRTELGFQWLCRILPSYRAVLIVFTLFFCVCIYIAFKEYIQHKYWSLAFAILFFFTPFVLGNMSGMRSGFVTCFFFLAILAKQKYDKTGIFIALGLIGLAFLFHRSAIGLAPVLFIPGKPFNKYVNFVIYIVVGAGIYLGFRYANEINLFALGFAQDVLERRQYDTYFEEAVEYAFNMNALIKMGMLLILMYITLKSSNEEADNNRSMFLKYTALLYGLMVMPNNGFVTRFYYYFAFPCIIGCPYVLSGAKQKRKIVYFSVLCLYMLFQVYVFYKGEVDYFTAYDNILTPW